MGKIVSFAIPCYNSAEYMDHCIQTIIDGSADHLSQIEIIIVDDGSTKDDTLDKAKAWEARYPGVCRAVHQDNAGHGGAVNKGLMLAEGAYFKVVDSDDWLDAPSLAIVLDLLESFARSPQPVDLMLCNYVYEHVEKGQEVVDYKKVLPMGRVFGWDEIGKFPVSSYILMHSVIYRTQVLRDCGIVLPEHTFYVDNIFVYVPLPSVKTIFYLDLDLYRYFIGREDQSVNESVMAGRIEQQLRITRVMIDSHDLAHDPIPPKLAAYMSNYLLMMMTICTVFSILSGRPDKERLRWEVWDYMRSHYPAMHSMMRRRALGIGANLPGKLGEKAIVGLYRIAQRLFSFN